MADSDSDIDYLTTTTCDVAAPIVAAGPSSGVVVVCSSPAPRSLKRPASKHKVGGVTNRKLQRVACMAVARESKLKKARSLECGARDGNLEEVAKLTNSRAIRRGVRVEIIFKNGNILKT